MRDIVICTTLIGAVLCNAWTCVTCYRAANSDDSRINRKLGKIAACHVISGCFGIITITELFCGKRGQMSTSIAPISLAHVFAYFFANYAMVVTMR